MKVLWFTGTPSLYDKHGVLYNGAGWIESLEEIIAKDETIELALCFFHPDKCFKETRSNTTYYPLSIYDSTTKKLKHKLFYEDFDEVEVSCYLKVIEDFQPDVIHVFGTERSFGLISKYVNIPVIIHIQGILAPCLNAYFPPGSNLFTEVDFRVRGPFYSLNLLWNFSHFKHNTNREKKILKNCKYLMGRTKWDRAVTTLLAPEARYFYCGEILRQDFYNSGFWKRKKSQTVVLSSTISKVPYKGFDIILKAAKILKEHTALDFRWHIYGIAEYKQWEKKLGFKCSENNITLCGVLESKALSEALLDSDIFIHPSYIDNSPNSVCEAQMLGLPVIANNVGGLSSLIEDGVTGFLVPANDPFFLASRILQLVHNGTLAEELGRNARNIAIKRHDRDAIKADLLQVYKEVVQETRTSKACKATVAFKGELSETPLQD